MSVNTVDPANGFSEQVIGYAAQTPHAIPYAPLAGCRASSGVIDHFGSFWPWGSVLAAEVLNGAPNFRDSVFFEVIVNAVDHEIGDEIRVQGQAIEGGGGGFQLPPQTLTDLSTRLRFSISDAEALRFVGSKVEVIAVINRGGSVIPSASLMLTVAPALEQTGPIVIPGVVNGQLEIDRFPDGVALQIPRIINMRTNNAMEVTWHSDTQPGPNPLYWRDFQRVLAVTPGEPFQFHIQPSVYQDFRGEWVKVFCSYFLGAGMSSVTKYGMGYRGTLEFQLV
ncbi:hypothetical protein [Pseudomonas botevensis]|uniref:hypothetical protein n=1 Tax=Pseudomonas botevensis TaxID=2842352 RepID=UPI001C3E2A48|nr:hypothetical protein [Pseudomonas botevensis]MBV4472988.1 hypothetical protein [Pseudomonas botevensis]